MNEQAARITEIGTLLSPEKRIDTSFSVIFLKGGKAFKVKRALRNGFLDYSTLEKRRAMCEWEFRINSRNSPELYRGVIAAARGRGGELELHANAAAPGHDTVEYLLEMNRFEETMLLSRLAAAGRLTDGLCSDLAGKIALMHGSSPLVEFGDYAGNFENVVRIIIRQFSESTVGVIPEKASPEISAKLLAALDRCRPVLAARAEDGFVRECHGDLHLGNICLFNGAPCIFDAVEFNTEFTRIDTLYDIAFLIMDLHHHGLSGQAGRIMEGYLSGTGTSREAWEAVMPLYLGLRAVIRCSISAGSLRECRSKETAARLREEALRYFREADGFLS